MFGISAETTGNGIIERFNLDGYKTLRGLKTAVSKHCTRHKRVIIGYVIFRFTGNQESKYDKRSYNTIEQFNLKPFYAYWD